VNEQRAKIAAQSQRNQLRDSGGPQTTRRTRERFKLIDPKALPGLRLAD
jgi:hypothetical protein